MNAVLVERPAPRAQTDRRAVGIRLLVALGSVVSLTVLAWFVLRTGVGQRWDDGAMTTVVAGRDTRLTVLSLLGRVSIGTIVVVATVCVLLALAQGRLAAAAAALVVLAGANVTTQVLKHGVLERVDGYVQAPNSFPSGHTTVVAAGVAALLLVAPRVLTPLVAFAGSAAITLTACSTIVAGWHRPADVVGSVLVALAWAAFAALVTGGARRRVPGCWLGALTGAGVGLLALVAIGVRPAYGWSGFAEAAVVLGSIALAVGVLVALMGLVVPRART
ncbi:phosphatase PAP2 family protein [Aeromicrobium halocynthiae]|uniref:phosphatase PAP2 family protein n=1 Tax=Aeromicrobium halocynthiae TaxID=560557 RepID=UPI0031DBC143